MHFDYLNSHRLSNRKTFFDLLSYGKYLFIRSSLIIFQRSLTINYLKRTRKKIINFRKYVHVLSKKKKKNKKKNLNFFKMYFL